MHAISIPAHSTFAAPAKPRLPWFPRNPRTRATMLGGLCVPLWALWPALALQATALPAFQLLAIAFAAAFCVFAGLRLHRRERVSGMFVAPAPVLLAGILGILGANVFYIFALRFVPPAEANIVAYTWPVMIVGLGAAVGLIKPKVRHWIGLAAGFAGVWIIVAPAGIDGWASGYLLALGSGLSWAVYSLARVRFPGGPGDIIGGVCGLAAVVCFTLHLALETTVLLEWRAVAAALAIGILPAGIANVLWDYGVSRGDARSLSIAAYATPLLATLLLLTLGETVLTWSLAAGGFLVVAGAVVGGFASRR